MNYFVIGSDGQKYGPADVATLNEWAQQNRLFRDSMLEDAATGARVQASTVAGINFPAVAPNAGYAQAPTYQPGFVAGDDGSKEMRSAWISCAFAFFCCPLIGGILGIVYSIQAQKKGHPQANTALIVSILCMVLGFGFGIFVNGAVRGLNSTQFR